ncbi:MAG: PGPGW domain-containing protein [Acidobacteria bacterium]|nr:PGPGW domain-containing protein [Acidobacteriota bacterium]
MKRGLRVVGGMTMLIVGLAGWVLPIIPGWLFVIPGLMLLGREFHWARRTLEWLKTRLPKKSLQD